MTEIHPLLRQRRSSRLYDPKRPMSPEMVESLLEAARWAPSGGNRQPWRYVVFDERVPEALQMARSCLSQDNQAWANLAPVLIAAISQDRRDDGRPNAAAQHDLGLANMSLLLQAIDLGLSCRPMGGFDADKVRSLFHIPDGFTPRVMIAIGYPGDLERAPESVSAKEASPRQRRPLDDLAYHGDWGRAVP